MRRLNYTEEPMETRKVYILRTWYQAPGEDPETSSYSVYRTTEQAESAEAEWRGSLEPGAADNYFSEITDADYYPE